MSTEGKRGVLRFPQNGVPDAAGAFLHPLSGLPLEIVGMLGEDLAGLDACFAYFNHFFSFEGPLVEGAGGGWTLSGPTGAATIAVSTDSKGALVLTIDNTANGVATLVHAPAATGHSPFRYADGKRMWCFARLKFATVASTEFFMGFCTPDTSPTTTGTFPSDGIFFEKAASATDVDLHGRKDGTSTEKTSACGVTLADDTYVTIGFLVDGDGNIIPYNGLTAKTAKSIAAGSANLPIAAADALAFQIGILAQALTCTIDWLCFGAEL